MFDEICRNAEKCDIQVFEWGEVAWLHEPDNNSGQRLSAGLVKFFPGKTQGQHIHFGEEQILYVIEGQGVHALNGRQEKVKEGMLIYCPPYSEHEVVNSGEKDLVFLITYTPSRLLEAPHNVSMVKGRHFLQLIDPEILSNIQGQVTEMLGLSVTITDSTFKPVSGEQEGSRFCGLCQIKGMCTSNHKGRIESINKAEQCCLGVMKITVPISFGDEIPGYINCGGFLIKRTENYREMLIKEFSLETEDSMKLHEIMKAYDELPLLPKSRLYALQDGLEAVSKIISGIIENNLLEKELNEKNTEILNNTREKLDLENALKEANIKLMKSRLSSSLKNSINLGSFFTKKSAEYPIALEEELAAAIKKLDMDAVKNAVKKLMDNFYNRELPVNTAKDMLSEMLVSLSRIVYKETGDEGTFLSLRFKYKSKLEGCYAFKAFEQLLLELTAELTETLGNALLKGSHSLIHKVNLYIKNNYNQDISLNSLADIFYISPNYLSTLFNEKNGMNLKDYINKLRIEKSKEYLNETDMKISEISRKVGFSQLSYFGSVFKKLEHCTPMQWRSGLK